MITGRGVWEVWEVWRVWKVWEVRKVKKSLPGDKPPARAFLIADSLRSIICLPTADFWIQPLPAVNADAGVD
jgi:hypothetical protein